MMTKKIDVKHVNEVSTDVSLTAVNLYNQEFVMGDEMTINYTYTEFGKQMMILDHGAPVSLAGITWIPQYLQEFGHTIEQLNSVKCCQPFVFYPSRRYLIESLVELPVLVKRLDEKEDVLIIQTYLVDAEVPFWRGKRTLESWDLNIDGREKVLEIASKIDSSRIKLKMIDTQGGHYNIV